MKRFLINLVLFFLMFLGSGEATKRCTDSGHNQPCPKEKLMASHVRADEMPKATELLVFVSFSMSDQTLTALHQGVSKVGGRLILKGLHKNSIQETYKKLKELAIDVDIDPPAFEECGIKGVPTFVHVDKENHRQDRLMGNVSVDYVVRTFSEEGEVDATSLKRFWEAT